MNIMLFLGFEFTLDNLLETPTKIFYKRDQGDIKEKDKEIKRELMCEHTMLLQVQVLRTKRK